MSQGNDERPQVEYRRLGKSGLRVSVPILGAMSFGSSKWLPWVIDEDKAIELLKAAWDRGVTTIDTANMYSNGESERIIGRFIKKYNIPRHRILILTKCYFVTHDNIGEGTYGRPELLGQRDYVNQAGLSRAAIFNQVNASLERLDTPYIDLLQIHRFDPETPIKETMQALHDLVLSGKVRYIGASSMRAWQFAEMNAVAEKYGYTQFVSMQSEYSLLYREDVRPHVYFSLVWPLIVVLLGARNDPLLQCPWHWSHPMGTVARWRSREGHWPRFHPKGVRKRNAVRAEV